LALYLFTNLASETPFYNIGFDAGSFMVVGIPTRFPKYFLSSKFFIAIKFLIRHIYKNTKKVRIVQMI
jgi:hypothetical protein